MLIEDTNRAWGWRKKRASGQNFNGNKEDVMGNAFLWFTTQSEAVISYKRFGTTYLSYIEVPRIQVLDSWPLKMGPIGCPETSGRNYNCCLCNNPEDCSSHLLSGVRLKSLKVSCLHFVLSSSKPKQL